MSSLSRSPSFLAFLPIPNHPVKVEVIFCVQAVISPMLSNIYLHEVLDRWFEAEVKPRLKGEAFLMRYADDAVLVFARKEDAERVMAVLPKRFGKYGLTVHPQKTRLICFGKPQKREPGGPEHPRWEKFNFLGFTHYWGRSRKGAWVVKRKTESGRFTRALKGITEWCKRHRHLPLSEQQRILSLKLKGHYAYYGITGNYRCLSSYLFQVQRVWHKWLARRGRGKRLTWERFYLLLQRYPLPCARVVHSYCVANP
jgi:RNA-directed DNA polymerase